MEIQAVIVCDAATVREGLLHILGGGITRMWRPTLPAPFGAAVALLVDLSQADAEIPHEIGVTLVGPNEQVLARAMGGLQVQAAPNIEAGEHMLAPFVLNLQIVPVALYGQHRIDVTADMGATVSRRLWILHPEELTLPPLHMPEVE